MPLCSWSIRSREIQFRGYSCIGATLRDLAQILREMRRREEKAEGRDELKARGEALLLPGSFLWLLLVVLRRRHSSGSDFVGLEQRGSKWQQHLQGAELLKTLTLLRLHESLDPR